MLNIDAHHSTVHRPTAAPASICRDAPLTPGTRHCYLRRASGFIPADLSDCHLQICTDLNASPVANEALLNQVINFSATLRCWASQAASQAAPRAGKRTSAPISKSTRCSWQQPWRGLCSNMAHCGRLGPASPFQRCAGCCRRGSPSPPDQRFRWPE